MNALGRLQAAGQSIWLDFLRRGLVTGGGLERLMREDAVSGVTSNPTIFGRAIGGSTDYDEPIRQLADKGTAGALEVFYDLALADIGMAADVLRPRYEETGGADGFVSFELEPALAHDRAGSVAAAVELFERIGKPNVMIKVPGTAEGVAALEELTAAGVNVNLTSVPEPSSRRSRKPKRPWRRSPSTASTWTRSRPAWWRTEWPPSTPTSPSCSA